MPDIGYVHTVIKGVPVMATPREIDISTADELRTALLKAASGRHPEIIVDMTGTRFCDSSGINALIRAQLRIAAEGRELRLVISADGSVPRVFALVGIGRLIRCFTSLEEALAHTSDATDPSRDGYGQDTDQTQAG